MKVREIETQIQKASRLVNGCEKATMYVIEEPCNFYRTVKQRPEKYLYKVSYENGKLLIETQKKTEAKTTKTVASQLQDAANAETN